MTPVETLGLEDSIIRDRSFAALQSGRHFESLKVLDLCHTLGVRSGCVLRILSSAPVLEHFMAPMINVHDVIDSEPWICTQLKTFVVGIDIWDRFTEVCLG